MSFGFSRFQAHRAYEQTDLCLACFHDSIYNIFWNRRLHFFECVQDWFMTFQRFQYTVVNIITASIDKVKWIQKVPTSETSHILR